MRLSAFLDDAAVFPPGDLPLPEAVTAHLAHRAASYGDLVGPLVVPASAAETLAAATADLAPASLDVSVTVPSPEAAAPAIARMRAVPALRVVGVEVAVPADQGADEVTRHLAGPSPDVTVWVELPRDARRAAVLAAVADAGLRAKLRTGGLTADLFPGVQELADAVVRLARAGVTFKATAGLHHAVRHTDAATGFEHHGFANLLLAAGAAAAGADVAEVAGLLGERDAARVGEAMRDLDDPASTDGTDGTARLFASFGTCSVEEPVADLAALDLLEVAR